MTGPEIAPCPFCGNRAKWAHNHEKTAFRIHCEACGCRTQDCITAGVALVRWNTRTPASPSDEQVEAAARAMCLARKPNHPTLRDDAHYWAVFGSRELYLALARAALTASRKEKG